MNGPRGWFTRKSSERSPACKSADFEISSKHGGKKTLHRNRNWTGPIPLRRWKGRRDGSAARPDEDLEKACDPSRQLRTWPRRPRSARPSRAQSDDRTSVVAQQDQRVRYYHRHLAYAAESDGTCPRQMPFHRWPTYTFHDTWTGD